MEWVYEILLFAQLLCKSKTGFFRKPPKSKHNKKDDCGSGTQPQSLHPYFLSGRCGGTPSYGFSNTSSLGPGNTAAGSRDLRMNAVEPFCKETRPTRHQVSNSGLGCLKAPTFTNCVNLLQFTSLQLLLPRQKTSALLQSLIDN